jgi:hypothetical protein
MIIGVTLRVKRHSARRVCACATAPNHSPETRCRRGGAAFASSLLPAREMDDHVRQVSLLQYDLDASIKASA